MSAISLPRFVAEWLPRIEAEMASVITDGDAALTAHYGMMRYHLNWANQNFEPERTPAGKRLRPIFCLLACAEVGGDVDSALPAGAAIELLHNFSLIHDDIEDGDEVRRHRPTVWKIWGVPQAINAGDAMFTLAFAAIQRLADRGVHPEATLAALAAFTRACLELTEGQHLDMSFEQRDQVHVDEYLRMIRGKTAALVAASLGIGAQVGGAEADLCESLWNIGQAIGLAFQVQDDILGIWGDPAVTGKAAGNDILRRKKSLPLLHALGDAQAGPPLNALLQSKEFGPDRLDEALALLDLAGSRAYADAMVRGYHELAAQNLHSALGPLAKQSALMALAESLLGRTG